MTIEMKRMSYVANAIQTDLPESLRGGGAR